mmetsp:Transcript_14176/g.33595  ORF Transcript_14176/g.33595 Transcript_14176/m.33595 type:complete len:217 (-) Transcript_14176:428-1078(-)
MPMSWETVKRMSQAGTHANLPSMGWYTKRCSGTMWQPRLSSMRATPPLITSESFSISAMKFFMRHVKAMSRVMLDLRVRNRDFSSSSLAAIESGGLKDPLWIASTVMYWSSSVIKFSTLYLRSIMTSTVTAVFSARSEETCTAKGRSEKRRMIAKGLKANKSAYSGPYAWSSSTSPSRGALPKCICPSGPTVTPDMAGVPPSGAEAVPDAPPGAPE